ncbi:unnamed protein product [Prunus armeniaca]
MTNGVRTYDKSTGKMFTLRAAVMWTVNDFPAYAMVSGWSTKGYMACPVCNEDVTSGWHAGKVCYLGVNIRENFYWCSSLIFALWWLKQVDKGSFGKIGLRSFCSSSSVPVGVSSPFVSSAAASFFDEVVSKRKFIHERTYQFDAVPLAAQESANQILEHYHLQALNSLSGKFNIPVIQEFYSNFPADPKGSKYQILVRSVPITLKPSVINRVLGFRSCPGFDFAKFALASAEYSVDLFKSMAYTDQSLPLTSKGLPIKSYLSPFYKFLWDFICHNVLPTRNNSNPTLAACQLMISMVNHDKIPLGDILYNAILGKTIGHGTKHKGTLVFLCLIQRLCEKNGVAFLDSDQWHPPIAPYGKASAALSQKVSRTFLTSVSSSSENASLRAQLAAKEEYIQHLLSLIPSTSTPAPATDKDSDDSVDSGGSLVF